MGLHRDYKIIKKSGLFDEEYYLRAYPDVRKADIDPLWHFVKYGWREGRNPSKDFDLNFYLSTYPDVRGAGINPVVHYILTNKFLILNSKVFLLKLFYLIAITPNFFLRVFKYIKTVGINKYLFIKIRNFIKGNYITSTTFTDKDNEIFTNIKKYFSTQPFIPKTNLDKPIGIIVPIFNGKIHIITLFKSLVKITSLPIQINYSR